MTTSRTDFNNTWLFETPMGIGTIDTYQQLVYNIKDLIKYGVNVIPLPNNLNKIDGEVKYYWFGDNDNIILGTEVHHHPQGMTVSITGKNPTYKGKQPFASELYSRILDDNPLSLRLMSDQDLSDEGYELWKNMLKNGYYISIYDKELPGGTFNTLHNIEEFNQYFKKHDPSFRRYQYVLSNKKTIGETRGFFHIRRYRELCGPDSVNDYVPVNERKL